MHNEHHKSVNAKNLSNNRRQIYLNVTIKLMGSSVIVFDLCGCGDVNGM